jgi:CelD/BcsL family acetyltransferase involved in cellulose biosynthesis
MIMFTTRLITSTDELATLKTPWNNLAGGLPMRSWNWLATWWKYYGAAIDHSHRPAERELRVIAVFDNSNGQSGRLVGVAPWYLDRTTIKGNVLRWLGSGEVCTDHQSLICRPVDSRRVAAAVAECLTVADDGWDRLELSAVDADDMAVGHLVAELEARECLVSRHDGDSCWVVDLPSSWDDYLSSLSKQHRKQLRQSDRRVLQADGTVWHRVETHDDLERGWAILVDLHQRRRRSLGEPGCFASRPFHDFHREVAELLLANGQLRLRWLEVDGAPIVAEYHFAGPQTTFSYQSGVDPQRMVEAPGHLGNLLAIRRAMEEGHTHFDFLRGDEPYKTFWRATPRPTNEFRIVPNRRLARLRGRVLGAVGTVSDWVKHSVDAVTG